FRRVLFRSVELREVLVVEDARVLGPDRADALLGKGVHEQRGALLDRVAVAPGGGGGEDEDGGSVPVPRVHDVERWIGLGGGRQGGEQGQAQRTRCQRGHHPSPAGTCGAHRSSPPLGRTTRGRTAASTAPTPVRRGCGPPVSSSASAPSGGPGRRRRSRP